MVRSMERLKVRGDCARFGPVASKCQPTGLSCRRAHLPPLLPRARARHVSSAAPVGSRVSQIELTELALGARRRTQAHSAEIQPSLALLLLASPAASRSGHLHGLPDRVGSLGPGARGAKVTVHVRWAVELATRSAPCTPPPLLWIGKLSALRTTAL
jgi:hypothetical protein